MPNCIIGILSFMIILLVCIVYFNKSRINSFETKLYGYMIIIDLLITIFAVLFYFVIDLPNNLIILRNFIGKGICVLFVAWYSLFSIYLTYLLIQTKTKKSEKTIMHIGVFLPYFLFFILLITMIIILPLYYHSENLIKYSYGPSANVVFLGAVMAIILSIITLIINRTYLIKNLYLFI